MSIQPKRIADDGVTNAFLAEYLVELAKRDPQENVLAPVGILLQMAEELAARRLESRRPLVRSMIYAAIDDERLNQDAEWGKPEERKVPLIAYLAILTEEVGEVAEAILKGAATDNYGAVTRELNQVGAVSVAIREAIAAGVAPFGIEKGAAG